MLRLTAVLTTCAVLAANAQIPQENSSESDVAPEAVAASGNGETMSEESVNDALPPPYPNGQARAENKDNAEEDEENMSDSAPQSKEFQVNPTETELPENGQMPTPPQAGLSVQSRQESVPEQIINTATETPAAQELDSASKSVETKAADPVEEKPKTAMEILLERNPFGSGFDPKGKTDDAQQNNPAEPPQGLELRGIYCVDGKWSFSVTDSKLKTSYTLNLGGKISESTPYAIDFFDDETNSVSISNGIGAYTLSLKERDKLTGTVPNMVPSAQGGKNVGTQNKNANAAAIPANIAKSLTPQQQQQMQNFVASRSANSRGANSGQNTNNSGAAANRNANR